jgi:DNA-binding NtrC family response regulator
MSERSSLLVVEDEAPQRRLIAEILEREGHVVRQGGTVDEALEAIENEIPDLILCDWRMPGRDGGELLDDVRARALGCAFIVMTAYGSIAHAVDAIRRGADDFLGKPFERDALILAVQRVLRTRRLEAARSDPRGRRFRRAHWPFGGDGTTLPYDREGGGHRCHGSGGGGVGNRQGAGGAESPPDEPPC